MAKIIIFSGAGISAESGISTFRDKGGLWEQYDIKDICTAGCLKKNRKQTIEFYDKRREDIKDKVPNKAHLKIKDFYEKYIVKSVDILKILDMYNNKVHMMIVPNAITICVLILYFLESKHQNTKKCF